MQVDLEKLEVAMKYIDRMADGKNPVKNLPVENDSVLNNPNVIRCMYFIKEVLTAVKDSNGMIGEKATKSSESPFPFECLSGFQYIEDTSITHFLAQLKSLAPDPDVRGIATKTVTSWLKSKGYLIDVMDKYTGKTHPEVTDLGRDFGLYMEERTSARGDYLMIMYSQKAQEYLAANMEKIVNEDLIVK